MKVKHFLSLSYLGPEVLAHLVDLSLAMANGQGLKKRPLKEKIVGIFFRCSSTRTRTAFTAATLRLGGKIIQYGPSDLQLVAGETMHDTGRVLSGFLDMLVIRTNGSIEEMQALADQDRMAVINAMSDGEHPTQAIADIVTLREALGRLDDKHILYIGEGNNTASALALSIAQMPGMRLTLISPDGYGLPMNVLDKARALARRFGADVEQYTDISRLPRHVDAVYTTRWCTMGVTKTDTDWQEKFRPYRVTPELMAKVSKPSGTIFLHDLPAMRGCEVAAEVLDGPQSVAFRQAQHKLTSAMAILSWCATGAQV